MSVWTMLAPLLTGLDLAPGQLAELRAINTLYYTELARNEGVASTAGRADSCASNESASVIDPVILSRVRAMLHDEQRLVFDRNLAARQSAEARGDARVERQR